MTSMLGNNDGVAPPPPSDDGFVMVSRPGRAGRGRHGNGKGVDGGGRGGRCGYGGGHCGERSQFLEPIITGESNSSAEETYDQDEFDYHMRRIADIDLTADDDCKYELERLLNALNASFAPTVGGGDERSSGDDGRDFEWHCDQRNSDHSGDDRRDGVDIKRHCDQKDHDHLDSCERTDIFVRNGHCGGGDRYHGDKLSKCHQQANKSRGDDSAGGDISDGHRINGGDDGRCDGGDVERHYDHSDSCERNDIVVRNGHCGGADRYRDINRAVPDGDSDIANRRKINGDSGRAADGDIDRAAVDADNSAANREIVCLGLGRFTDGVTARYQLALLLALRQHLRCAAAVFDPVFTRLETDILLKLGFDILSRNTSGAHPIAGDRAAGYRQTLFFLPHCPTTLINNLLWSNWSPEQLKHCVLIANSLAEAVVRTPDRILKRELTYIDRATAVFRERLLHFPPHLLSGSALLAYDADAAAEKSGDVAFWRRDAEPPQYDQLNKHTGEVT